MGERFHQVNLALAVDLVVVHGLSACVPCLRLFAFELWIAHEDEMKTI
jgi:hypothetical protein